MSRYGSFPAPNCKIVEEGHLTLSSAVVSIWVVTAALGPVSPIDDKEFFSRNDCDTYMVHRYSNAFIYTFQLECRLHEKIR